MAHIKDYTWGCNAINTSWPLNSWSVTENSNGYQISYIRLLSKFVNLDYDCNGDYNGTTYIDSCENCAGGSIDPINDSENCETTSSNNLQIKEINNIKIFPNPADKSLHINISG